MERPPRANFERTTDKVLRRLVCGFGLFVHHSETFPVGILHDANSFLVDEAVVSERVEVSHIVRLLAERLLDVALLHEEGAVVPDYHPVEMGRHFCEFPRKIR